MVKLLSAMAAAVALSGCAAYTSIAMGRDGDMYIAGGRYFLFLGPFPFVQHCAEGERGGLQCQELPVVDVPSLPRPLSRQSVDAPRAAPPLVTPTAPVLPPAEEPPARKVVVPKT